jgi:phosphatidylglycerol---prolipoprotein diacylglyceryl transferase
MVTVTIDPILFHLGPFAIRWYSLIIMAAVVAGFLIAKKEAERKGFSIDHLYDIAGWLLFGGLIGARFFHVIDHWQTFAENPGQIIMVWEGGLAIWGAVAGGLITLVLLARKNGWNIARLLDMFAPALVLGQGIGRLACVITGDAVGRPTSGPFGLAYTNPHAMVPELGVYYTPTPIYEFVMNLGIFAILWRLRKHRLPDGALFFLYLSLYSIGRFIISIWSSYQSFAFGLNQAQFFSVAALLISLPILVWMVMKPKVSAST